MHLEASDEDPAERVQFHWTAEYHEKNAEDAEKVLGP